MLVISDSSPINFLVRMNCHEILPQLFGKVVIPNQVQMELSNPKTPSIVRAFIASPPDWLEVRTPANLKHFQGLGVGESAAMTLAIELHADLILLDDGPARNAAKGRNIPVIGLLGILERAADLGLIRLADVVSRLPADYRIDPALVQAALFRQAKRG